MNSITEVKHKYRIKIDDGEPIDWNFNKKDSIKDKGETLITGQMAVSEHMKTKKLLQGQYFTTKDQQETEHS